jgi:hypothetical protein
VHAYVLSFLNQPPNHSLKPTFGGLAQTFGVLLFARLCARRMFRTVVADTP